MGWEARRRGLSHLSRSCVPVFGISGRAGLASPQIPEQIRGGGGRVVKTRGGGCGEQQLYGERKRDLKNRILSVYKGEEENRLKKKGKKGKTDPTFP